MCQDLNEKDLEHQQPKASVGRTRKPYIIMGIVCVIILVAAVVFAGVRYLAGTRGPKTVGRNASPMVGHISKDGEALLFDGNGERITFENEAEIEFAQCIATADRKHIIVQDANGSMYMYDGQGKNPRKIDSDGTFIGEHYLNDQLLVYYKNMDKSDEGVEKDPDFDFGCYIYEQEKQVDLGICSNGSFTMKDNAVLFAQKGSIYYFDTTMNAPEKVADGNPSDYIEFLGVSDHAKTAVWSAHSGAAEKIYCYEDGIVQILGSMEPSLSWGDHQVKFFNNGVSMVVYGGSKMIIKEGSETPWELVADGTIRSCGVLEHEGGWRIYYIVENNDTSALYTIDADHSTVFLQDGIMNVWAYSDDGLYFTDTDRILYRGIFNGDSQSDTKFAAERILDRVASAFLSGTGDSLILFQYHTVDLKTTMNLAYTKTDKIKVVSFPQINSIYLYGLTEDETGIYYIDRMLSDDDAETLVLYYQAFDSSTPVEIDRNIFLFDAKDGYCCGGPGVIYFKQVFGEDNQTFHLEMYTYYDGKKQMVSDSVVY